MLFDDASSQFLRKTASMGAFSVSFWFKPDDLSIDTMLWAQANAAATAYFRVQLLGASGGDAVACQHTTAGAPNAVSSSGVANLNAWNHVYAAQGVLNNKKLYISLNGEALQTTTGGSANSGAYNTTQMGRMTAGLGLFNKYYSGQINRFGAWDNALNEFDDRWKSLYTGVPVWEIPTDPSASIGLLNLISDTKLMGSNINDDVSGAATWLTSSSPTAIDDHPNIRSMGE